MSNTKLRAETHRHLGCGRRLVRPRLPHTSLVRENGPEAGEQRLAPLGRGQPAAERGGLARGQPDEDHGAEDEPEAYPPKAAPATAAPREPPTAGPPSGSQLEPGLDLSALASQALERREEQPEPEEEPEEKKRRFEENRKAHYKMGGPKGGLAALRAQAAAAMAEAESSEEDEDNAEGKAGDAARQS